MGINFSCHFSSSSSRKREWGEERILVTRNRPHPLRKVHLRSGCSFVEPYTLLPHTFRQVDPETNEHTLEEEEEDGEDGGGKEGRMEIFDAPPRTRSRIRVHMCELEHQPPRRSRFAVIEVHRKFDLERVSFFTIGRARREEGRAVAKGINWTRRVDIL